VDPDGVTRQQVEARLEQAGYHVTIVATGERGLELSAQTTFDLIVLEGNLRELDGVALCRTLRGRGANRSSAILIVGSRSSEIDKIVALEGGADDYLARPFGAGELVARANAVVRARHRGHELEPARSVERHGVVVTPSKRQVTVRGVLTELTKQEFDLLELLVCNPGIAFSREALIARVWGNERHVTARTVDAVVSRLRQKVEADSAKPGLILTVWGIGYRCADAS
jgi:DNA-binding response OmpR family regulator